MHGKHHESAESQGRKAIRVTLIGSAIDLILAVFKILAGLMAGSYALVTDGIHSLSDLITDGLVILLAKISHQGPDANHPYGHRRFETIGTVAISVGLFIVAGIICYDSISRIYLIDPLPDPGWSALLVAAVSIASKEWIYRYTKKVGNEIGSSMLLANAWHSRTDALSSIVVFIGIIGVWLGFPWMDLVAAIFVGLMIARIAWSLITKGLAELVDQGMPADKVEQIRAEVVKVPGILDVHDLRTRLHGEKAFLDIHVQVNNRISVSEGHFLGDQVAIRLRQTFPVLKDIIVHIDPELDVDSDNPDLPSRQLVESTLLECWKNTLNTEDIHGFVLHYLNNKVDVEVKVDMSLLNNDLVRKVNSLSEDISWLNRLTLSGVF